jgi:hypothetical protein
MRSSWLTSRGLTKLPATANRRTSGFNPQPYLGSSTTLSGSRPERPQDTYTAHEIFSASELRDPKATSAPAQLHPPRKPPHTHNRSDARPQRNAATATRRPGLEFRARPFNRLHDVERPLRHVRLTITHCRRLVRVYGAGVPKRRFAILVE